MSKNSERSRSYICNTSETLPDRRERKEWIASWKGFVFCSNSKTFVNSLNKKFSQCSCMKHACFLDVAWNEAAFYSPKLAKAIGANAQAAMCDV